MSRVRKTGRWDVGPPERPPADPTTTNFDPPPPCPNFLQDKDKDKDKNNDKDKDNDKDNDKDKDTDKVLIQRQQTSTRLHHPSPNFLQNRHILFLVC